MTLIISGHAKKNVVLYNGVHGRAVLAKEYRWREASRVIGGEMPSATPRVMLQRFVTSCIYLSVNMLDCRHM